MNCRTQRDKHESCSTRAVHVSASIPLHYPLPIPVFLLASLLVAFATPAFAFQDILPRSARSMGIGVTLSTLSHDPASRIANPAAAGSLQNWGASLQYARQWGLAELDRFQGSVVKRIGPWTGGVEAVGFGKGVYEERSVGLSLSRQWDSTVSTGIALRAPYLHIEDYVDEWGLAAAAGVLVRGDVGAVAAVVENLTLAGIEGTSQPANLRFRLAGRKPLWRDLYLHLEWEVEEHLAPTVRIGLETLITSGLRVSAGYDDAAERIYLGVGIRTSGLRFDSGNDYHTDLGWSHAYGITWSGTNHTASGP